MRARVPKAHLDLALGKAKHHLVMLHGGPAHGGDGGLLVELVADGLLVAPLLAQLVHKHDVVTLSDGQLGAVRRERHAAHQVVLCAVRMLRGGSVVVGVC
jgi:hypothetical protein